MILFAKPDPMGPLSKLALVVLLSVTLWLPQSDNAYAASSLPNVLQLNGQGLSYSNFALIGLAQDMGGYFMLNPASSLVGAGELDIRISFDRTTAGSLQFKFTEQAASFPLSNINFFVDTVDQGPLDSPTYPTPCLRAIALTPTQLSNGYVDLKFINLGSARGSILKIDVTGVAGNVLVDCGLRILDGDNTVTQPRAIACKDTSGMTAAELATYPLRINSSKIGNTLRTYGIALVDPPTSTIPNADATKVRVRINNTTIKALRKYP